MSRAIKDQAGFTLTELLLAMAFFSYILLALTAGYIQLNRQYVKGQTVREVHQAGRVLMEQITRDIRSRGVSNFCDDSACGPTSNFICIGGSLSYQWDEPVHVTSDVGVTERIWIADNCSDATGRTELIPEDVAVWDIEVTDLGFETYKVDLYLTSSGESIKVDAGTGLPQCATVSGNGSQYCDVVTFSSITKERGS